jgi:hypothetical protein
MTKKIHWSIAHLKDAGFDQERILDAMQAQKIFTRANPDREWLILPHFKLQKLAVISKETIIKGQNDVGAMLLDQLPDETPVMPRELETKDPKYL